MQKIQQHYGRLLVVSAVTALSLVLSACQPAKTTVPTTPPVINTTPEAGVSGTPEAGISGTAAAPSGNGSPAVTPTPYTLPGAKTTGSGLQVLEEVPGTGQPPKPGDLVTMNFIVSLADGTQIANTYTNNKPVTMVYGLKRLLPGWEEGIGTMRVGGKSKFVLPPALALGDQGSGSVPPNSQLVIEMELLDAKASPDPTPVTADQFKKTASGLQYYDLATGSGAEAAKSSNVTTDYTLWVKTQAGDYNYVASSEGGSGTAANFVVGRGDKVFPGWEEGVTGMKVGGRRQLIIPPELGLGSQGNATIPANSTLVMEIQLKDVKQPAVPTKVDEKDFTTTKSGLKYYDIQEGSGAAAKAGDTVTVDYTGWLQDGTQFDSSIDRGQPFSFKLGAGSVIPGWEEGLVGMKVGGKRQLVIPPALGYGDTGSGATIPGGATLIFEVQLNNTQP